MIPAAQLAAGALVAGLAAGAGAAWWVRDSIAERADLKRKVEEQDEKIKQEKRNAEITSQYVADLAAVQRYYQHNPVRVYVSRREGEPGGTSCPDVSPKDVIFSGGKAVAGNGAAAP